MARRGVRLIVICENGEHERFARYALLELSFHRRELRFSVSPAGRGAAEQWVRKRYATEVRIYRGKASYQRVGLVVVIDADQNTVENRVQQLADELADTDQARRGTGERIAHWIPRRQIETWIAFLRDQSVSEEMDCKRLVSNDDYRPAAESFARIYRKPSSHPAALLQSLSQAFEETNRLETRNP